MVALYRAFAATMVAAALAGCSSVSYYRGKLDDRGEPRVADPGANLPAALLYLDGALQSYQAEVGQQMRNEQLLANALVGTGALVVALAVGGANSNIVTGTALAAGTAYGLGNLNLPRQRVLIYMAGVEAMSCADKAVTPMRVTLPRWQQIESAEEPLRLALSNLDRALVAGKSFVVEPGSQEGEALAQALELGDQVRRAAAATMGSTRDFLQSGHRLVAVVNGIDQAVVRSIVKSTPELSAVPALVGGLAGLAGSFAPGSGVEALLAGKVAGLAPANDTAKSPTVKSRTLDAARNIVDAAATSAEKASVLQGLLPTQAQWSEDAFKSCGIGIVVSALSASLPSLQFTVGVDGRRSFSIAGGVKPYFVSLEGPSVDGLSLRPPTRFDNQVEVSTVGSKLTKPAQATIRIVDSSPAPSGLDIPVTVAAASAPTPEKKAAAPDAAASAPAGIDADLKKIKDKGQFKLGGKAFRLSGVPVRNGDAIEVAVACPAGDTAVHKRADLAKALLAEAGISTSPPPRLLLSTVPPDCAPD